MNQDSDGRHLSAMVDVAATAATRDLVREISDGSDAAFTELVALHHRDLQRVAYVICRDTQLAEDAVQAAWTIAWHRIRDLRDPARLRPWLVAIAANEARAIVRRRSRGVIEIGVADIGARALHRPSATPEGRIDSLDLARAMAALNPADRALLALRFVADLDSVEIGRATRPFAFRGTWPLVSFADPITRGAVRWLTWIASSAR